MKFKGGTVVMDKAPGQPGGPNPDPYAPTAMPAPAPPGASPLGASLQPGASPPPQQPGFGAPPAQGYGAPAPPQAYGGPAPAYGTPPQPGFGAPPQPGFGAPPQPGFGAPQQGFAGQPVGGGFGAPGPAASGFGNAAPNPGGYGGPPPPRAAPNPGDYGAPAGQMTGPTPAQSAMKQLGIPGMPAGLPLGNWAAGGGNDRSFFGQRKDGFAAIAIAVLCGIFNVVTIVAMRVFYPKTLIVGGGALLAGLFIIIVGKPIDAQTGAPATWATIGKVVALIIGAAIGGVVSFLLGD